MENFVGKKEEYILDFGKMEKCMEKWKNAWKRHYELYRWS